jgi:hypothetical protein
LIAVIERSSIRGLSFAWEALGLALGGGAIVLVAVTAASLISARRAAAAGRPSLTGGASTGMAPEAIPGAPRRRPE